jgi:hypothetical protein
MMNMDVVRGRNEKKFHLAKILEQGDIESIKKILKTPNRFWFGW